jgi:hypothetical protein
MSPAPGRPRDADARWANAIALLLQAGRDDADGQVEQQATDAEGDA